MKLAPTKAEKALRRLKWVRAGRDFMVYRRRSVKAFATAYSDGSIGIKLHLGTVDSSKVGRVLDLIHHINKTIKELKEAGVTVLREKDDELCRNLQDVRR